MADLSLLFQLRADNAQAKATLTDTQRAVAQLRSQFGNDLKQMQGLARNAVSGIGQDLESFVAQRIPLIGGAFQRVTQNLRGLNEELRRGGPQTQRLAEQIDAIAKASGKSTAEVSRFLTSFTRLRSQSERNEAAFKAFGGSVDLIGNKTANLLPQLEEAGASLAVVSTEAASTGAAVASMAGPIAIAVAALAAQVVVVVSLTKEIFNLAKASADYQGKLFDLSQQVGVSVETLSALEVVARTTGGSIDSLVQSLGIFQRHLEESVEDRGSKAAKTFRQLGVDATDTETALRQTIAALARMPEGFRQTALALEVFGRGGKAFLAIAKEANGDIDEITRRLEGLGLVTTAQAKLADEFNDQLVLLQVQLRGLGTQSIPVVLDVLRDLSDLLKENRILFEVLGGIIKAQALIIRTGLGLVTTELEKMGSVLRLTVEGFERIKNAVEFVVGHPIKLPFSGPAEAPAPTTPAPTAGTDKFTEELKDRIEAEKRLQGVLNFAFAEQQQRAQDSIALAQRAFEAGKRTRQQLLDATIEGTQKQTKAEIDGLEVERGIKLKEQALAKDDLEKKTQLANAILALDIQIANKRSEQARNEANLRAQARREEERADLASQQAQLDTLTRLGADRIAFIEDQLKQELVDREVALAEIEKIEKASLVARGQLLKKELALAGVGPERQVVLDKIKAIEAERTELERRQSQRRREITREEFESKRQIILSNLDAILQLEQIRGEARIAAIKALADLGVKAEEQAAKDILAVRLRLLDAEIEATKIRQKATASITDPKERRQEESELANQLKILNATREAIQAEGNRDIERGRQQDLDNERRYARELESIRDRINNIQQDAAREAVRLMELHFAKRRDIIRAQRDLELAEETERHQRATEAIKQQQDEVEEQIKILESYLRSLKIGTTEEIEEHDRLIESLEKLRLKREELKRQQEAEDNRTKTRKRRVTVEADVEIANPDAALRDAFDEIGESITDLTGKFAELIGAGEEFGAISGQLAQQIGGTLAGAFDQVANALGQTVANWVLLGETGPAVMRKILAQALASLAAEATVQAIKELALGFAMLFINPAESGAHFTAAALWGTIAGVSAIAGRAVAGDLFKPKTNTGSGGSGGSGGGSNRSGDRDPIDLTRTHQTIEIIVRGEPGPGFENAVISGVVSNVRSNGPMRTVIKRVAEE